MLLADVLALASRKVSRPAINEMNSLSPRLLIDFATLTGERDAPVCSGVSSMSLNLPSGNY